MNIAILSIVSWQYVYLTGFILLLKACYVANRVQ